MPNRILRPWLVTIPSKRGMIQIDGAGRANSILVRHNPLETGHDSDGGPRGA